MSTSYMKLLLLGLLVSGAHAHGYTKISRNYKCKASGMSEDECGLIIYEPQSLEGPLGFPNSGPPDGQLASAGLPRFNKLNEQSPNRWPKTNVQAGPYAISWHHGVNHATRDWQYFLTKQYWNPSVPLSRSSFDNQPFYTAPGFGKMSKDDVTHNFNLPARTGYQVILAVWTRSDGSGGAFYNMNDVQFGGGTVAPPSGPSPPSGGFCNWGNAGTAASSTCEGGAMGGDWCNASGNQCESGCSGRWCTTGSSPPSGGFCNWGNAGTAASSTCEGGTMGGDWCNASGNQCEVGCGGRWCT
jgi:predicted carbohydrate-binding protein with CBM5 and CBM33 domain